jgi:integrase/recombinase XerD
MINKDRYIEGFTRWQEMLNYDSHSIKSYPVMIEKFFDYIQKQKVKSIEDITAQQVKNFFQQLSETTSKRTGEAYSLGTLRTYLTALKRFTKYIQQAEQINIDINIKYEGSDKKPIEILTNEDIKQLYEATEENLLGMRDRAMIAVYYGCGARRNEGLNIRINDILPDKNLLYIRKGKNYKERYIPMIGQVKKDIIDYLTIARPMMMNKEIHDVFFVSMTGNNVSKSALSERMKKLIKKARIEKKPGLHLLRHSIATHLHQQGMKLTEIARFLGHSSLESTQIYTHLINDS